MGMEGQADMTKPIVALCSFAKAPKNTQLMQSLFLSDVTIYGHKPY